jgi:hypothetical protein
MRAFAIGGGSGNNLGRSTSLNTLMTCCRVVP